MTLILLKIASLNPAHVWTWRQNCLGTIHAHLALGHEHLLNKSSRQQMREQQVMPIRGEVKNMRCHATSQRGLTLIADESSRHHDQANVLFLDDYRKSLEPTFSLPNTTDLFEIVIANSITIRDRTNESYETFLQSKNSHDGRHLQRVRRRNTAGA
jgi:hypothetical protein